MQDMQYCGDKGVNSMEIEVILNGTKEKVPVDTTISQLLVLENERDKHVVVELNNKYVFLQKYETTVVSDGDRIEFINPDFGG
ncbi:MAG: thiamine biosynthesis protein ThiS [Syntrophus sp. (in: bacteria)]|nr:thiamine biosynthesis protein ThiS [Syntrophus sp. (in: bacteria)]